MGIILYNFFLTNKLFLIFRRYVTYYRLYSISFIVGITKMMKILFINVKNFSNIVNPNIKVC